MALMIPFLRSCHLVSIELGEWVMYILGALNFDLILFQFAFLWRYNFLSFGLLYLGFTSQSTTTTTDDLQLHMSAPDKIPKLHHSIQSNISDVKA